MQAINEYSEKQRNRILSELQEQNDIELERAEKETVEDVYRLIQIQASDVKSGISRDLAAKELEIRRRLLTRRTEIEESVFAEAAARLSKFAASDKYGDFMRGRVREAASVFAAAPEDAVFRVREEDAGLDGLIREAYGAKCEVKIDPHIKIGGVMAENHALGRAVNATLDSRLEEQREWFRQQSGMQL
ncbi:MAG: V-type ATP synthase subunit E family protein [Oscillospiraceae bacterium]|nr:V-type ATP synthase subunit E family protein [Oscillospiraceae bacterium]